MEEWVYAGDGNSRSGIEDSEGGPAMTTKETLQKYFDAIHKGGWESYIADDFVFVNSNLDNAVRGKSAYIEGAGRFFRATTSVEIRRLIIEKDTACVVARYHIRSPKGLTGVCDVAEILTVEKDKIDSSAIFFDTKVLAEFIAKTD